jgi:dUTP pyrophosphatase
MDMMNNEAMKELMSTLDEFLNLDDENLTDGAIDYITAMLKAQFTDELKEKTIIEGYKNLKATGCSLEQAKQNSEEVKSVILSHLQEKQLSENKIKIVSVITDYIFDMLDGTIELFKTDGLPIVHFQLVHPNAKLPTYAHETDAGADIYLPEDVVIYPNTFGTLVHTGLKVALPKGWEFQVRPRSGLSSKTALRVSNTPGTIDAGFRGEVCVIVDNLGDEEVHLSAGDRIAQLVFQPVYHFFGVVVDDINTFESDRGEGGFGSSGN